MIHTVKGIPSRRDDSKRCLRVLLFTFLVLFSINTPAQDATTVGFNIGHAELTALQWSPVADSKATIIALPWSGGTAIGYRTLGPLFAAAGYRLVALNPRGFSGSTGSLQNLTLHDYADDVAAVINALELDRVHMLGWALGNRVARAVATDHPERVATVSLIAAGGMVPPLVSMAGSNRLFGERDLPLAQQIAFAREALFASATPDSIIKDFIADLGYFQEASAAQSAASRATPVEQWWAGGNAPMLIVQGLDDKIAPPQNGILMQEQFGERIRIVNLEDVGHLMGLEKPEEVASAVLEFLEAHPIQPVAK